jgi:hypothetical protein
MNLTKEQLLQNAEAMIAFANGKSVQWIVNGGWQDWNFQSEIACWHTEVFRPKPEPKTRPWNYPDDVPLNCWLRRAHTEWSCLIIMLNTWRLTTVGGKCDTLDSYSWEDLSHCEYSIDRKTWLPCVVTIKE